MRPSCYVVPGETSRRTGSRSNASTRNNIDGCPSPQACLTRASPKQAYWRRRLECFCMNSTVKDKQTSPRRRIVQGKARRICLFQGTLYLPLASAIAALLYAYVSFLTRDTSPNLRTHSRNRPYAIYLHHSIRPARASHHQPYASSRHGEAKLSAAVVSYPRGQQAKPELTDGGREPCLHYSAWS